MLDRLVSILLLLGLVGCSGSLPPYTPITSLSAGAAASMEAVQAGPIPDEGAAVEILGFVPAEGGGFVDIAVIPSRGLPLETAEGRAQILGAGASRCFEVFVNGSRRDLQDRSLGSIGTAAHVSVNDPEPPMKFTHPELPGSFVLVQRCAVRVKGGIRKSDEVRVEWAAGALENLGLTPAALIELR